MGTEIKFKNGSYIKVLESNESKRPTNIDYQTNYLGKFDLMDDATYWNYKLCVYYYAKTELYDRTLTDLRSPFDPTEAYIQGGIERSLSCTNARKLKRFVNNAAIGFPEHFKPSDLNAGKYHYSAQEWIDEYNRLVAEGEMDSIIELEQRFRDKNG